MNSEYCIVIDSGLCYATYDQWIRNHFGWYMTYFEYNHSLADIKSNRLYKIIGHAPHDSYDMELYLIQDTDTKQVFIIEKEGIVITTTVSVKNTNTIHCDNNVTTRQYTYGIRGGRNMNNKLVDLYYERKREEIRNKYKELLDNKYEQLEVVKEYNELVNTFVTSLAEMANRYNTEETKFLIRTGYMGEYTYDLNPDLKEDLREVYVEDFNKEMKELELLVEEVRAQLSLSDDKDYQVDVLTRYDIINKKGKLNV